ncbi:hypothetical protein PLICRDRAFT_117909 [Plicaturopsis crispa FD-325 SS-3]|uniref:Unplaced genomic scaffold PLICRscaffold_18, whole genome shotgun sequence n=1 Tax=Plicaturopsis crispa FD-325 SS-3 TaxID=944288 RepID=A0A0C9SXG8_PLICR|nr:hypothetical protein PLICRDRAFT_117909 [Plicaturopsis crispa FD-325 SS-3]
MGESKRDNKEDVEAGSDDHSDFDIPKTSHTDGVDRAYELKSGLINRCLQEEIGFGRYQIQLFILSGFGWTADNIWLQGVAVVLSQVSLELNPVRVEYASLALYVGLILGAATWGVMADVIGRRLSFNITLFLAGVFGIAAGAAETFTAFASLVACVGFGIGGNLPVDGALYLEGIPQSHQWTLTLLSAWWAVGQLIASVVAWGFIGNFSCPSTGECLKADNMGWRYTIGGITFLMFIMRFVIFDVQESPKYLIAKGRDEDAINVLEHMAKKNGRTITLTLAKLQAVSHAQGVEEVYHPTTFQVIKNSFSGMSLSHIKPLFVTKRLGINTTITILLWGYLQSLTAYPLYNAFLPLYLEARVPASSTDTVSETYRNYTIISVLGIPGSVIACILVDWTRNPSKGGAKWAMGGRKWAMALSTALTGIFLFLFTTSKTEAAVLGYSCASGLTQCMYGVLYAYTPEVFPAPHRGTGDAICSAFNRITGILAPVIKIATSHGGSVSSSTANGPLFVSASLFVVASAFMLLLPIEVRTLSWNSSVLSLIVHHITCRQRALLRSKLFVRGVDARSIIRVAVRSLRQGYVAHMSYLNTCFSPPFM